jgi:outer membrane protein OmpA-like peptidoglycan-associated protein
MYDSRDSLSASFTDLMTSLAVIFILLLVATTNATVHHYEKAKSQGRDRKEELKKRLQQIFRGFSEIEVVDDKHDPLAVIVVVHEGLLNFVSNSAVIPDKGVSFVAGFTSPLAQAVCSAPDTVRSLIVEGHTDERGNDDWNIQLSQQRAASVAQLMLRMVRKDNQNYDCLLGLMSVSGRGKNDLVYADKNKQVIDEDKSRRVEFHLRVPSFEQRYAPPPLTATGVAQAAGKQSVVETRHE